MASFEAPDIHISQLGTTWYWVVAGIYGVASLSFFIWSMTTNVPKCKLIAYISALLCYVSFLCYFSMGADLGWVSVEVEFAHRHSSNNFDSLSSLPTRQVFWVRYVNWLITAPMIMVEPLLLLEVSLGVFLHDIFMIEFIIVTGLSAAFVSNAYKWAYIAISVPPQFAVSYILIKTGFESILVKNADIKKKFFACSAFMLTIWLFYGLCWGLSEGGNVLSPDAEAIFYGLLDILSSLFYGVGLLWVAHNNPELHVSGG